MSNKLLGNCCSFLRKNKVIEVHSWGRRIEFGIRSLHGFGLHCLTYQTCVLLPTNPTEPPATDCLKQAEKTIVGKVHSYRLFARGSRAANSIGANATAATGASGFDSVTTQTRYGCLEAALKKRTVMSRNDCKKIIDAHEENSGCTMACKFTNIYVFGTFVCFYERHHI